MSVAFGKGYAPRPSILCQSLAANGASVNNSEVLINSNLSFEVKANTRYAFDGYIMVTSINTADIRSGFSVPTGTDVDAISFFGFNVGIFDVDAETVWTFTGTNKGNGIFGVFQIGGTAGTVTFQYAQGTAQVANTFIDQGSWIRLIECDSV